MREGRPGLAPARRPAAMEPAGVLIIGAGIAGLFTALKLAPRPVTVVTARALGEDGSSVWAQGGVAAAVGPDDSPQLHFEDTLAAGAGLVETEAARILCAEGPQRIADLSAYGAPFDRAPDGSYKLGREAAHRRDRIIHAAGDQAGAAIMSALAAAARAAPHITLLERIVVEDLLKDDNGAVAGALVYDVAAGVRRIMPAGATVLATGGLGGLYAVTTNPVPAQGHGLAFAARAGAVIRDAEFVQFHPTALDVGVDPAPLATEALRGDGAILIDRAGRRFMADYHADLELAPRDVVARAVEAEIAAGRGAFLDAREAVGAAFPARFPAVYASATAAGLDPCTEPMPVAPAAHYHMGGVATDLVGRASVAGLFAVGEAASSGVHGANRLASNSLLEAAVFGARIADRLRDADLPRHEAARLYAPEDRLALAPKPAAKEVARVLRAGMSAGAALLRDAEGLAALARSVETLRAAPGATSGLLSATTTAGMIVAAALARRESRGGHFRTDHPESAPQARHTLISLGERPNEIALTLSEPLETEIPA